jgi:putative transposase
MSVKELTQLTVTELMKEYKRSFWSYWEEHDEAAKEFRRRHIERALETERAHLICCESHERTAERKDYRNGYWRRWITVRDGRLEVRMPRIRSGGYDSEVIPRYQQRIKEVDAALRIFL